MLLVVCGQSGHYSQNAQMNRAFRSFSDLEGVFVAAR
jgi:hypothetical protein